MQYILSTARKEGMMANTEIDNFFEVLEAQHLGVTYSEVTMRTRHAHNQPPPDQFDTNSRFSRHVGLRVPFVSAAMDTVTGSKMAIGMAKLGGLGVIHCAMDPDAQRREVRRVKMEVNALVEDPRTVQDDMTLQDVRSYQADKGYKFETFPVLNADGKFVGMLFGKHFTYAETLAIPVADVMTPADQVTHAPVGTTLDAAYRLMQQNQINTVPLLKQDRTVGGLFVFSDVKRIRDDQAQYNVDSKGRLHSAAAVSTGPDALERVGLLADYTDVVVIDTADGDSYYAFKMLEAVKSDYPNLDVVVGNITDAASALELARAGADGIKVGQGPGSICSTQREIGIGIPQLTAVYECSRALRGQFEDIPICADGGIESRGDPPKALVVGAASVMMGRMLVGATESAADVVQINGNNYKNYRGMGSMLALLANAASRDRYDASGSGLLLPEGEEGLVPFEGPLTEVLGRFILALQKNMRYTKAPDLATHRSKARLIRRSEAGLREALPHDIQLFPAR